MVVELAVLRQGFAKHYYGEGGVGEGEGCAKGRVKLPCASPLYIGVEGAGFLPSKSIGALAKVGGKKSHPFPSPPIVTPLFLGS